MKKRILAILLLIVMMLTACGGPSHIFPFGERQEKAVLYFANAKGNDLTAVDLDVRDVDKKDLPRYILEKLLEGPTSADLSRAVRAGTSLLSVSVDGALVKVDLSKEYYHEESVYDVLALASIVKSLCSIRGITQVLLTVEGQPLMTAEGVEQGILRESDVVFDADALMQNEANISLYFSDANAEHLVREVRRVTVSRGESLEKIVMQELI
ncbi:MAG: GerMN domain-containing protein, partial [Clostridia bacterium]|nr:GerMN domain-containing protein [Clostridia bacterium]